MTRRRTRPGGSGLKRKPRGSRYLAERRAEADQERDAVLRELGELREAVQARSQEVERQTGSLLNTLTAAIDSLSGLD